MVHANAAGEDQLYYVYEIPATIYPTRPGEVDTGDVQIVMQYPTALEQDRGFFSSGSLTIAQARPLVETQKSLPRAWFPFRKWVGRQIIEAPWVTMR